MTSRIDALSTLCQHWVRAKISKFGPNLPYWLTLTHGQSADRKCKSATQLCSVCFKDVCWATTTMIVYLLDMQRGPIKPTGVAHRAVEGRGLEVGVEVQWEHLTADLAVLALGHQPEPACRALQAASPVVRLGLRGDELASAF